MKYFIRKRRDCISSFVLAGGEEKKKWRRGIKKTFFFGIYCVSVCDEWRGECEDWVLVEKRVEKKMSKTSTLCRELWKGEFCEVKLWLLEILKCYLLGWYPRDIKCRLFRSVKHKLGLTDFYFNTGKIPLFQ
jgi:hypothetical protein